MFLKIYFFLILLINHVKANLSILFTYYKRYVFYYFI